MKVYNYDKITKIYTGISILNDSDKDPKNKDKYLFPANCTEQAPPEKELNENFYYKFIDNSWKVEPYYVGLAYYDIIEGEEEGRIKSEEEVLDTSKYTFKKPDIESLGFSIKFNKDKNEWEVDKEKNEIKEKEKKVEKIQEQLKDLDVKKIRYLLEKETGDLSGKKYFDLYEAETLKLREELKKIS